MVVIKISPEWEILPLTGKNVTLMNITYKWLRYESIQLQYLPFRIYFYKITLLITTSNVKSEITFLFTVLYFANLLPRSLYTIVLPEVGQVGRNIL
jgi:hypothetical protein